MNISLGKKLEKLVEDQVKTGIYQNTVRWFAMPSVACSWRTIRTIRNFSRKNCVRPGRIASGQEELRQARKSPRKRYVRGEFQKQVARAVAARRRQVRAA